MLKNPKLTASATLNYSTELSGAKLDLSGTVYHSSSYRWELLGRVNTPNYTIFNAQIAITPRDSDFRISLWGKNLSNKAYFTGTVLRSEEHTSELQSLMRISYTVFCLKKTQMIH